MAYNWAAVSGQFDFAADRITFHGQSVKYGEEPGAAVGTAICDQTFAGGTIAATIEFAQLDQRSACDIIMYRDPTTQYFVSAGLARETLFGIRHFDTKWNPHSALGEGANLQPNRPYHVSINLRGSRVALSVDGVQVTAATLPFVLAQSQVGIFCRGLADIVITDYSVAPETPRAFVVMQFSSPYNELYEQVIRRVCKEFNVEARRADETFGPGVIIADVAKQIDEAKIVIAEITPVNPNVYYEVGYAHARNKPTILIADKTIEKLPFDVSPFRTLFYENTINGKDKIETGLRNHLRAVLSQSVI
jgi:hypothetical protein